MTPPPIVTLTGNLLAERTLTFATWRVGAAQRATTESFQVGGKGFNVSKMLHRLGSPSLAVGFAGGATGQECVDWLHQNAGYRFVLHPSIHATRTGYVVRTADGASAETTFLAPDRPAGAAAWHAAAEQLSHLSADVTVALCGSFPGWADTDARPLRDALTQRAQAGRLVVDSYGPPLTDLVQTPLRLAKINRAEFDALDAPHGGSAREALPARLARALTRWPVHAWIVTDGAAPAWLAERGAPPAALTPPPVREVSATGSGDVLLAGVLHAWLHQGLPLSQALMFALPLAAANAASVGVAEFPLGSLPPVT